MNRLPILAFVFLVLLCLSGPAVMAQQCQPPALDLSAQGRNIFTDQQEMDLGDVVYEQLRRDFRVIDDPVVTKYLQGIADRLIAQMPATQLRFQISLVELPDANALTMPGGRIFVSRKMVALAKDEDELAGVLAHELGHAFAHHSAIDMTYLFHKLLKVDQVTTREDIFAKYKQLIELESQHRGGGNDHEEGEQGEADLIGLYAMSRAGYDPAAQSGLWDRYNQTHGDTGSTLARIFGTVPPEKMRLAEMLKNLAGLPAVCKAKRFGAPVEFLQWQQAVIAFSLKTTLVASTADTRLPGLLNSRKLEHRLQNLITKARFSPDGRYLFAQDDAGIIAIDHGANAILFTIDQPDAKSVQFTPDSSAIVFRTTNLRVEIWDVAARSLRSAYEVVIPNGCLESEISPDGKTLACRDINDDLSLVDVEKGNVVAVRNEFRQDGDLFESIRLALALQEQEDRSTPLQLNEITMRFSPDGRYFLAGAWTGLPADSPDVLSHRGVIREIKAFGYDFVEKKSFALPEKLSTAITGDFEFVGPDKVVGISDDGKKTGGYYNVPSGEMIKRVDFPSFPLTSVTRGEAVIVPNSSEVWRCVYNLTNGQTNSIPGQVCLDSFDGTIVSQTPLGDLGFYGPNGTAPKTLKLPERSTHLSGMAISQDLAWVAFSNSGHAGVWNLPSGERSLFLGGFASGYFDDQGRFYADFSRLGKEARTQKEFNLTTREVVTQPNLIAPNTIHGRSVSSSVVLSDKNDRNSRVLLKVTDSLTSADLWTKKLPRNGFWVWTSLDLGTIVVQQSFRSWTPITSLWIKDVDDPVILKKLAPYRDIRPWVVLTVLDARTGNVLGRVLVDTGSTRAKLRDIYAAGNRVIVTDGTNRVRVYDLGTGEQVAAWFGVETAISPNGKFLCVQNEHLTLDLYDLSDFEQVQKYVFPARPEQMQFNADGTRLIVATADQNIYVLDTAANGQP